MAATEVIASLEALEAYALGLSTLLLGSLEQLEAALQLLLRCSSGKGLIPLLSVGAIAGADHAEVVITWCLSGPGLKRDGPPAVVRTLLLEQAVASVAGELSTVAGSAKAAPAWRALLLSLVPAALAATPHLVSQRLSAAVAAVLSDEEEAARWLQSLLLNSEALQLERGEAVRAYACAAGALLERHPRCEALRVAAWTSAHGVMRGDLAAERQACVQLLLPALVAATAREEAATRIARMVEDLFEVDGRQQEGDQRTRYSTAASAICEALNLATAFSTLVLDHWKLSSMTGDHCETGRRLIAAGLSFGLKECASLRKQARFLLESSVQSALAGPAAEQQFKQVANVSPQAVSVAWRSYWELFDALEDYSSHLLKSSWDQLLTRLMQYLAGLRKADKKEGLPPIVLSPVWLEVFLARSLDHDNDTVQKFILEQLVTIDQEVACLSETFILDEILPRFSHSIDVLYSRTDVEQTFERQVASFFLGFVRGHPEGPSVGAKRLLQSLLRVKACHHTPLRIVLSLLVEVDIGDQAALEPEDALDLTERFFHSEVLLRQSNGIRPVLAQKFLRAVVHLSGASRGLLSESSDPSEGPTVAEQLVTRAAEVVALVPDSLLLENRELLGGLVQAVLGGSAVDLSAQLLQRLCCARGEASWPPMAPAKLTLGAVRLIWASSAGLGAEPTNGAFSKFVWPALEPTLQDMHRRSYLSRSAAVATLFGCAYAAALLPDGQAQVDLHPNERLEMLSYVEAKAAAALGCGRPQEVLQEAAWVWLYALVLEQFWRPGLPHGEELAASTAKVLVHGAACTAGGEVDTSSAAAAALAPVAAAALLGVLAPKMGAVARRCELFLVLWRAQAPGKPSGVNDSRFSIGSQEELGDWPRSRLEEYEDLHRQEREGFGRVLEWRDASATFLLAKWRALALIARQGGSSLLQELPEACRSGAPGSTLSELAADLLAELDSLQPPQVAFWCVVARHIAFPVFFVESQDGAGASQEEQRQGLHSVCRALQGSIVQGVGEGSVFLPRGCMLELGSALCDPVLRAAELRLFASQETAGPLTSAVHELLSLGEVALNISRSVAVPLLATLLAEGATRDPVGAASSAEIFTSLLLHSDMTVRDGALCHSIGPCVGVVDVAGPGGKPALAAAVGPKAPELCQKFAGTGGLPRVLALTALDGLAQQQSRQGVPPVISATLLQLLAALRRTLEAILKGSGKPGQVSKPLTPMPLSPQHRLQLRGWQAVLVLGCHADRPTAEMLLPELFWHLNTPHLPDVRDYQELLGCALCGRFPDLVVEQLLVPALKRYEAQPQVGASLLVISSYLFKEWAAAALSPEKQALPAYAAALCRVSVPYLGHNSAYVRGIAAWGFFELVDAAKVTGVFEALEGFGELISELHCFLTKNVECQKMRRRLKLVFLGLELGSKTALESLTELSEVLPQVDEVKTGEAAEIPMPLHIFADGDFKPSSTFLTLLKDEVVLGVEDLYKHEDNTQYSSRSEHWESAQIAALQARRQTSELPRDSEAPEVLPSGQGAAGGAAGLQRKFVPPAPPVLPEECGGTSRGASVSALARKRAPLIVIASLVDKTPNLAGLCRTSEVFNCEALWLPNLKVATDQSFKTISVTAEKWLPLRGVSRAALTAELLEFRRKGYALVGVEQTHTSVPLDKWVFAEKTVMLLGAEKEGIHAELLPLMDGCVEIPQQGQLRSLNVHVSGSVVIWEYVRQARLRASAGEPSQEAIEVVQGADSVHNDAAARSSRV